VGLPAKLLLLTAAFVTREAAETSLVDVDRRTASLALAQAAYSDARAKVPTLAAKDVELLGDLLSTCCDEVTLELAEMMPSPRPLATRYRYDAIIGRGARIQELFLMLDKVIDSDATVMIQGENGTGKELIAKAIHVNSSRKNRRFVVQNCSAFNDNLLDSELFGHKRGAFTGAIADKQGLFEIADGGTFFLDEIGDMSPTLQVKLLRVLQEGTFLPVGDTMARKVDVRIIAATNRDLKTMVERGEFREDLFYRVNVINLLVPPLRDRKEDIPILVDHFLRKHGKGRLKTKRLTQDCLTRLLSHQWPGNVRELENEIERVVVLAGDEDLIGEELLSPRVRQGSGEAQQPSGLPEAVSALERKMIAEALRRHRGNKTRAAKDLRVSRRNLIRLVQKYELEEKGLRSGLKT